MQVHVRLFARARDLAGCEQLTLEVPPGISLGELRRLLATVCPALAPLVPHCALALGEDFAADTQTLTAEADIALLPPVSGGSVLRG